MYTVLPQNSCYNGLMHKWAEDEIKKLVSYYEQGVNPTDIAKELGIKTQSVKYKAHALGITKKYKYDFKDFVTIFREVHGDKYDYSEFNYVDRNTKGKIFCKKCNEYFLQRPHGHRAGRGCPVCAQNSRNKKQTMTTEGFMDEAVKVHGDKYDYSRVEYRKSNIKVLIFCKTHGYFNMRPNVHLRGQGCPSCGVESRIQKQTYDQSLFLELSRELHGDTYDYSKVLYGGSKTKVTIVCSKHGEFLQTPDLHINGKAGCPKCKIPYLHRQLVHFIENLGVTANINDRSVLSGKELDIYIPEKNLAIEINGLYWHRHENLKDRYYHNTKFKECEKLGIKLIQFWGVDLKNKTEIAKSMVLANLKMINNRVFARKCSIKNISQKEYANFLDRTHIQGAATSKIRLGLYSGGKLVAVMGFSKVGNEVQLIRYSNELFTLVVGGFSKLLNHARKANNFSTIVSFSDNFYSNGDVYKSLGFKLSRENIPRLHYTDGTGVFDRRRFQKKNMVKRFPDLTIDTKEREMAEKKGFFQIYGGGTKKWVLSDESLLI